MISTATSSPAEPARKTSAALERGNSTVRRPSAIASSAWRPIAGPGGDRLEAAAQTARAVDSVRIGDDVAHLAGKAVVAAEQDPVENDAGRDAGPDRQEGDARRCLSRPVVCRLLAQPERRRAGVVLDERRDSQLRLQHRSQRQVGDPEVDGHADRAVVRVDVAGDGDADGDDVLPQLAPCVADQTGDLPDER